MVLSLLLELTNFFAFLFCFAYMLANTELSKIINLKTFLYIPIVVFEINYYNTPVILYTYFSKCQLCSMESTYMYIY